MSCYVPWKVGNFSSSWAMLACQEGILSVKLFKLVISSDMQFSTEINNSVALVRERTMLTSDRCLSAKLVPTFPDRGCCVVSTTYPYGRNLGFLDRSRCVFFQVAPQLYLRGWVDPVPDPLLLRKSDSAGNWTRDLWNCCQELWPLDHRGGLLSST
jgi:hypothetical protein